MKYWAGLYSSDFHGRLLGGVKVILACAHKVLAQQAGDPTNRLLLPPPGKQAEDEECRCGEKGREAAGVWRMV